MIKALFPQNFYDAWIPKAQQNVLDLKQTATTLEKSDEHISQLLYVKDSQVSSNTPCSKTITDLYNVSTKTIYYDMNQSLQDLLATNIEAQILVRISLQLRIICWIYLTI